MAVVLDADIRGRGSPLSLLTLGEAALRLYCTNFTYTVSTEPTKEDLTRRGSHKGPFTLSQVPALLALGGVEVLYQNLGLLKLNTLQSASAYRS